MLKTNRTAREMLIKPNEEFSADRVIEKALRQDVGIDPSLSSFRTDWHALDKMDPESITWDYKKKYRDTNPIINPEAFHSGESYIERTNRQFDQERERPSTFINRPLTRAQLRKKFMRNIRKKDIEWKNTPFMVKFLNPAGKIYNRF